MVPSQNVRSNRSFLNKPCCLFRVYGVLLPRLGGASEWGSSYIASGYP
ncbi:hypothetical protein HNQ77_005102 [Silvibacterium bohemicum]|uniref:Uncharacterized protein n=1 Tax=Silvibacterium bohemicum TaxID=1577686 RepID=A0A841K3H9_9BACT|nr:hypothetical protein [Silvibacterium bohemicum]